MKPILNVFQEFLNEHQDDLTDRQMDNFYGQFENLRVEVLETADCDHENVVAFVPDSILVGASNVFSPAMPTGEVTGLSGECEGCGAEIHTAITITADIGGTADE